MGLLVVLRAFHSVQDFVALIDARSNLLLASKAHCVGEIADDPPVLEMQLGREIELDGHVVETSGFAAGSDEELIGAWPTGWQVLLWCGDRQQIVGVFDFKVARNFRGTASVNREPICAVLTAAPA